MDEFDLTIQCVSYAEHDLLMSASRGCTKSAVTLESQKIRLILISDESDDDFDILVAFDFIEHEDGSIQARSLCYLDELIVTSTVSAAAIAEDAIKRITHEDVDSEELAFFASDETRLKKSVSADAMQLVRDYMKTKLNDFADLLEDEHGIKLSQVFCSPPRLKMIWCVEYQGDEYTIQAP